MVTKRVLCFANSRKHGDRCVAGREVLVNGQPGDWIRPVSSREDGALTLFEQRYSNHTQPALLDVMDIQFLRHEPQTCQSENWVIDHTKWWTTSGSATWDIAVTWAENPDVLFVNAGSTYDGEEDEIPEGMAQGLPKSLTMIHVPELRIRVHTNFSGALKVRAEFIHNGQNYSLQVTDPHIEDEFKPQGAGYYPLGESLLCISLGLPFQKTSDGNWYRYKLAAGVIRKPIPI